MRATSGGWSARGHWSDYPIGVARELVRAGYAIEPANLLIRSSVPEGSGLSSSAALEVSCALALLRGRAIDPLELGAALPARRGEFRRHAVRHHGSIRFRVRARKCGGGDRLPQPATPLRRSARRHRIRSRQQHGEARAGEFGISQAGGGVRGGGGDHRSAHSGRGEPARCHAGTVGRDEGRSARRRLAGARATW